MELETDGNLQGTTALRNRARLLRKESRKQVIKMRACPSNLNSIPVFSQWLESLESLGKA